MGLYLKPTEIRYTQETISGVFRQNTKHKNTQIGKTLDDILVASSSIDQIPKINVFKKKGQWYSFDNRRLWIFKKLEEYGKCSKILVKKSERFQKNKFTTKSDGTTVKLRGGDAGGTHWRQQEELVKSHHSDPHDITTSFIQESTAHVRKEPTAELHNNTKNTETKRTPSCASLTTRSVHGDGAENFSDLKIDTSSWPSSAILDLYFPIMLESSWTSNRNGLDKADTKLQLPETSDGLDSTFNDSHYDETPTLPVSPEKSDDGPDSTLGDFHNDVSLSVSPEKSYDEPDSTLSDFYNDVTCFPVSRETCDEDSDSTFHDSDNDVSLLVLAGKSDDEPDTTLGDFHHDVALPVSPETSDDGSDSTLTDSLNDVTLPLSQEMCVCDSDSTPYDSNNQETSSTDTTPMSPVLTELIADTELLGLRLADLGMSFLTAGFPAETVRSTSENQTLTFRSSSEYGGEKKKNGKRKKKVF